MDILIAEDDFVSSRLLQKMLETLGHKVLSAEDGLEAWEIFQKNRVRMVITDWMMPQMDGLTLSKKIRSDDRENYTYIIILTAKDRKQDLVEVFEAGADDYITKPFDPEELQARIKTSERIIHLEEKHKDLTNTLVESRNKLRVVFDSLHEEMVSIDEDFRIVSANRALFQNRRISYNEIVGKPCFTAINGQVAPINKDKIESSVKTVRGYALDSTSRNI